MHTPSAESITNFCRDNLHSLISNSLLDYLNQSLIRSCSQPSSWLILDEPWNSRYAQHIWRNKNEVNEKRRELCVRVAYMEIILRPCSRSRTLTMYNVQESPIKVISRRWASRTPSVQDKLLKIFNLFGFIKMYKGMINRQLNEKLSSLFVMNKFIINWIVFNWSKEIITVVCPIFDPEYHLTLSDRKETVWFEYMFRNKMDSKE